MKLGISFTLGLMLWLPAFALPARIVNARQETRSAASGLERLVQGILASQTEPGWVGYAIPAVAGRSLMCCSDWAGSQRDCTSCRLEEKQEGVRNTTEGPRSVRLEAPAEIVVLYRIAHKQMEKVRVFSADCELDFGGLPLIWLNEVKPAESLRWLGSVATDAAGDNREGRRRADGAVLAIAHHQLPAADRLLETLAAASRPLELRKQAAFWMGTVRGRAGYENLRRLVREDTNERFREHITFALSQSQEPEAIGTLIQAAREDTSARVRGQALFWLAQKAGRRAAEAITAAIDQDPETQVKKKAVFALHQLPKDEGIPLLIQVARNNKNPVVRKEAMFWLGQSKDSRALEFFEEVLSK
jgi:HEAT repeat protein